MTNWWAKKLQNHVDDKKLMNERQYARKGVTTIANLVSRTLTFNYHLIKGTTLAHIDYDAKNCYDRVVPEVAVLASKRMGMHSVNAEFIVQVLNHFRHHLMIKMKQSNKDYRNTPLFRILGIGQGMGWSPTLWSLVNDITMTLMEKTVPGECFSSPLSSLEVSTSLEAYVDDVHGGINEEGVRTFNEANKTELTVKDAILLHLHKYERYLRSSGGAWSRASGYFITESNGTSFYSTTSPLLTVDPYTGLEKEIPMLKAKEETKTLGVWLSPGQSSIKQVKLLQSKVDSWVTNIGNSHLPRYHKQLSLQVRLRAQLSYPVGVICLTKSDSSKIMRPLLRAVKGLYSLPLSFPTSLLHLNKEFGGYDLLDLPILCLSEKMKLIEKYIREDDLVGKKTRILAETQQFESGVSTNIYKCSNVKARSYIAQSWLTSVSEALQDFGISMEIQMYLPEAPTIMDQALATNLNKSQLQKINKVRLHRKMMHVYRETYLDADWPRRTCNKEEKELFSAFLRNLRPSPLMQRLPVYTDKLHPLTKPVLHHCQRGSVLTIAYDGSLYNSSMAASISVFHQTEECFFDSTIVHGSPASSTRAELYGVIMSLTYALEISNQHQYESIELFGDNSVSIGVINQPDDLDVTANKDLVRDIESLCNRITIPLHTTYVKSHQDRHVRIENLPHHVQAHVRCDFRASNKAKSATSFELLPKPLPHQQVIFRSAQGVIPTSPYNYLKTAKHLNYVQDRLGLSAELLWKIDWKHFERSAKKVNVRNYTIFQKLLWEHNPTATRVHLYNKDQTETCPLCQKKDDAYHFLSCSILCNSPRGKKQFEILKTNCSRIKLSPFIWDIYKQATHLGDVFIPEGLPKKYQMQVRMMLRTQKELGWKNFLFGRIHNSWRDLQKIEPIHSTNGQVELEKFWGYLFNYYCELWRDRCYYADIIQRQIEDQELNTEIAQFLKRDWTLLSRKDRNLEQQAPDITASTDLKKNWLFQVTCAFEFAALSCDSTQKNLFDFGFAVFDPV